jgi:DMSO/TMAO reductase YedYZ molybdopterin-dependent catalytic subunit
VDRLKTAGVLGAGGGLAASFVASAITGAPFPPAAIAEVVIRSTPGDVTTFFIEALEHWALRLLTLAALAVTLVVGAGALVLVSRDRPRPARAAFLLAPLAMLASAVAPSGDKSIASITLTTVAGALAYAAVAAAAARTPEPHEIDHSRRRLVIAGAGAVALTAGGWWAVRALKRLAGPNTDVDLVAPELRATVPERGPFPDIPGLSPEITSVDDHYVVDINPLFDPAVEAADWSLSVEGAVDNPMELGFAALQERFEIVEEYSVLACVSNEVGGDLVGHSLWGGVRLADVLEAARVSDQAVDVVFRAADRYSDSIPIELARDPSVLVAVAQNGKPLTQAHGFPCRVRIPAIFGMKNVKWLTKIEVVTSDYRGFWQRRGWSDVAEVRTQSRIDVVGENGLFRVGKPAWIAGVAWAGARGIERVEVSTDGGAGWHDARLKEPIAEHSWHLWAYEWTPEKKGRAEVVCRATDGRGDVQTSRPTDPHPAGATGYHSIGVEVT